MMRGEGALRALSRLEWRLVPADEGGGVYPGVKKQSTTGGVYLRHAAARGSHDASDSDHQTAIQYST